MIFCNEHRRAPAFAIILLIGFMICCVAIATPAWQVTDVPSLNMTMQHGLWMSCQKRLNGIYVCLYSFAQQDDYNKTVTRELSVFSPKFTGYQHMVLALFMTAQVFALLCMISYFFSRFCNGASFLTYFCDVCTTAAAFLSILGCIVFWIFTHMEGYNTFDGETSTHQFQLQLRMRRSYSFYVMIVGTLFYIAASICCILRHVQIIKRSKVLPISDQAPTEQTDIERKRENYDNENLDIGTETIMRKMTPHPRQHSIISAHLSLPYRMSHDSTGGDN